jgi:hypothetical protein
VSAPGNSIEKHVKQICSTNLASQNCSRTEFHNERYPLGVEEATLLDSQKYRQFADDCLRMAEKLHAKDDKESLRKIAEAWVQRAIEAEKIENKRDGG